MPADSSTLMDDYRQRAEPWSDIQDCLERLYDAAVAYPQVSILELGVRWGTSTAMFLAAAEQAGGHLWSVDLVVTPELEQVRERWLASGHWTFVQGNDLEMTWLVNDDVGFDVLFIDTSHAYAHTLAELRKYVPLVKPGGVVYLHDTKLEAPELVGPQPPFPVARALDEFCAETGRAWTELGAQYGLGKIGAPNG